MSIFGDLADLPFPEIFNMLGRRTGRLEITGVPGVPRQVIHMDDGTLRGLEVGDSLITDPLRVRDRLIGLMDASQGSFRFLRTETALGDMDLPATQMLMSIASAVDEIGAYRDRFAHPGTFFRDLATDIWLDAALEDFYRRAHPYLAAGASAEGLARQLDVSIDQVQLYLYKLRSVGKVTPVRAYAAGPVLAVPPEPAVPTVPAVSVDHEQAVVSARVEPATSDRRRVMDLSRLPTRNRDDQAAATDHAVSTTPGFGAGLVQRMLRAVRQRVFAG